MHEGIEPIEYYHGIFDKYKENNNLDSWMDFPNLMWGWDLRWIAKSLIKNF